MTIKYAVRSLKNDFSKVFFYCLTFILTTAFIFLFFNIAMGSEANVHFINSNNDSATNVTIIIIVICMIIIFFANDFFIKNKSKELAIILISGGTYFQLATFLLIQTFLILLIAIPCGITLAILLTPSINVLMTYFLKSNFVITYVPSAIFMTVLILILVVFWTTYLNMAFAYRNTANSLLNEREIKLSFKENFVNQMGIKTHNSLSLLKSCLFIFIWLLPIPFFYIQVKASVIWSIIGLVGFNGVCFNVLSSYISHKMNNSKLDNHIALAYLGFLKNDLNILRFNICLFLGCAIFLISLLVSVDNSNIEIALILLSYTVMNLLQSLAIMFKFLTELITRRKYFMTLKHIGYLNNDLNKIINKEIITFYMFILLSALLYISNILYSDYLYELIDLNSIVILIFCLVIPLLICMIINLIYYKSLMIKKDE